MTFYTRLTQSGIRQYIHRQQYNPRRWLATSGSQAVIFDPPSQTPLTSTPQAKYWKNIPFWEDVSQNEFIDYKWQVNTP